MPVVAAQLGRLELYAWTFSAYLLSSTIAVPIYGKLADLYGRKPSFLIATGIFVVGSMLCGLSQTMPQLIVFRFLQGLGGGGLYPITLTIVGDVFELQERARLLGVLAAIWGVSAVVGPAVGGFVTEQLSWRWAFFIQLPLALAAMVVFGRFLHEQLSPGPRRFDTTGALLLASAITTLLLALQGSSLDLDALGLRGFGSALAVGDANVLLFAVGAVLSIAFVACEHRAAEPLLPLGLFGVRAVAAGSLTCLLLGVVLFGQASFVPPLLQGVMGATPTAAGLTLSCTSIGWPIASNIGGRTVASWGYRKTALVGGALLVVGFVGLRQLDEGSPLLEAALVQVVLGAGFGFVSLVALLSMQNAVEWTQRGVATGLNQFATNLGGVLGLAVAGALFASALQDGQTLQHALEPVFLMLLLVAAVGLAAMTLLPGGAAR
jgi:EmrB/QacA subfamily drug resistance transporter